VSGTCFDMTTKQLISPVSRLRDRSVVAKLYDNVRNWKWRSRDRGSSCASCGAVICYEKEEEEGFCISW
jgi:hypothetical protein